MGHLADPECLVSFLPPMFLRSQHVRPGLRQLSLAAEARELSQSSVCRGRGRLSSVGVDGRRGGVKVSVSVVLARTG